MITTETRTYQAKAKEKKNLQRELILFLFPFDPYVF